MNLETILSKGAPRPPHARFENFVKLTEEFHLHHIVAIILKEQFSIKPTRNKDKTILAAKNLAEDQQMVLIRIFEINFLSLPSRTKHTYH